MTSDSKLDEEARLLLCKIVESQAWRQLAAINILGHCLKLIPEIDAKVVYAEELSTNLRLFREVQALYRELGWTEIETRVRDRLERIPFPASHQEFSLCHYLCELAEEIALESYVDSTSKAFAAIARSYLDQLRLPGAVPLELERFGDYCADPGHRAHAQTMLNRWLPVALLSFGRPDTKNDARAVALGLRAHSSAELSARFLGRLMPVLRRCGLSLPDLEALGIQLSPLARSAAGA